MVSVLVANMNLFIRNLLDTVNDMRWSGAYRRWNAIKKEIDLRRQALEGTTVNANTIGFTRFLERRIAKLLHDKTLVEFYLEKFQARWKNT
jgi:hypothetical protein